MHRLINVSANSQIYPSEHNLKLLIVQEETDNMLHAYLDLENYTTRMKQSKLSAWVQSEEMHSGASSSPLRAPPFLSLKLSPHRSGYITSLHRSQ